MTLTIKALHLMALGLWLGGVTFFSFFTALPIIDHMKGLAKQTDNWAGLRDEKQGVRMAGEGLGAVFARYFPYQVACGVVALLTALTWWSAPGWWPKVRVGIIAVGLVLALVNLLVLAPRVSELRAERYSADADKAAKAEAAFGPAHTYSLITDMVTLLCVAAAMVMAAGLSNGTKSGQADPTEK